MASHGLKRARPAELVPGTVRVITARMDYLPASVAAEGWQAVEWARLQRPDAAAVSMYARGRDYHKVLRARLQKLADQLAGLLGPLGYRVFTDSAPVLEVELASRSGVGWRGKHTLLLSREAAHSERRIVRVAGDRAGGAIMEALISAVRRTPSIRVMEGYVVEELIAEGRFVSGVIARPDAGQSKTRVAFSARAVVLCSGGIGHLYQVTTNPAEARGTGLGMAARAGAVIADPEFVQFHPTAIDIGQDPAPLATEALRGDHGA